MSDREREKSEETWEFGVETEPPADDRSATASDQHTTGTPTGSDPEREPESSDDRGPDPGPTATRLWTGLTIALAFITALSAVAIATIAEPTPAIGAGLLAVGFAAIVGVSRATDTDLIGHLAAGWAEHRRYVGLATGLFGFSALLGAGLFAAGIDLTQLFFELIMEELGEGEPGQAGVGDGFELSAGFFIFQNTPPFLASIVGGLILGVVPFVIMVLNGILIGNIAIAVGSETGFGLIVALIAPHGIFELPALFIAAGIGFRFFHRAGQRVLDTREALFTRPYLARTATLILFGWFVLVLAAFVEAYLTIPIAELLFPEQAGQ